MTDEMAERQQAATVTRRLIGLMAVTGAAALACSIGGYFIDTTMNTTIIPWVHGQPGPLVDFELGPKLRVIGDAMIWCSALLFPAAFCVLIVVLLRLARGTAVGGTRAPRHF